MNGQIVCCKNINDGEHLRRTIEDLSKYLPFMRSVSAVPAGITKYRDDLPKLDLYTKEEAGAVIDLIESYQQGFYEKYGLHFIHASDEWYILAERDFPEEERSKDEIQTGVDVPVTPMMRFGAASVICGMAIFVLRAIKKRGMRSID